MQRFTPFLHRAARKCARRIRAAEKTPGQEQLPCSEDALFDRDLRHLSRQLQLSRQNQHSGGILQSLSHQQHECRYHFSATSMSLSQGLHRRTRSEHAPAAACHFSASAKGPREGASRAGQPPRQGSPVQQSAGHSRVRQHPDLWKQTSASVQSHQSEGGSSHQSRPFTAFAPGAQRPEQDSLDWGRSGSSKGPPQGNYPEGNADVRVVSEDKTHQVMPMSAALKLAKRERMDLLPVAPNARPPVFRLGDANEAAKQARLRERDMRRKEMENRRKTLMKEVKIGPNTQENDLKMKLDKAKDMVSKLYRVRIFIPYRMKDREAAMRMLQRLREICTDFANVAGPEGIEKLPANTVVVYLSPKT